jgi:hypothetical protein
MVVVVGAFDEFCRHRTLLAGELSLSAAGRLLLVVASGLRDDQLPHDPAAGAWFLGGGDGYQVAWPN